MLEIEKIEGEAGTTLTITEVYAITGSTPKVGTPLVEGARVTAEILDTKKTDKVRVFKMKKRKRYRVERGHRQIKTTIKITKVSV